MSGLTTDDQAAIRGLRDGLVRAILSGDAEDYAAAFSPEGVLMHPNMPMVKGSRGLLEYARTMFGVVKVVRLELTELSLVGDGGVAYEVGTQLCAIDPPDEHFKATRQYLHAYARQADGSWRIAAAMSGNQ
jgi:uncharacterized protein (TIGR02246 family)